MAELTVAQCHAQGGRLVYIGERPACELSTGDGDVINLALDTGLPIAGAPAPEPPKSSREAFGAVVFFGAAMLVFLFSRRRGR